MTVDVETLATLLPTTFAGLFTVAFACGQFCQWASSRKSARVGESRQPEGEQPAEIGGDRR
ncbi:hypothetical protein [Amycolatopsis sp. RTGN1]|uniref:hypothetical protein n=1 Tax=Amycolatopsis ponsaeliensis TaxID=2992142 RepID=UPI0025511487|nr:hypothetical protein [Amycolatopsis sp. RTGN1]